VEFKKEKIIEPANSDFIKPFVLTEKALYILDQRKLPWKEDYLRVESVDGVRKAIREMYVRGAPAIGIVTALGVYLGFKELLMKKNFPISLKKLGLYFSDIEVKLSTARPTAVNLFWALERMKRIFERESLKR